MAMKSSWVRVGPKSSERVLRTDGTFSHRQRLSDASQDPECQGPPATTRHQESSLEQVLLQNLQKEPRLLTARFSGPLASRSVRD